MGARCIWAAVIFETLYVIIGIGALLWILIHGGPDIWQQKLFYFVIANFCLEAALTLLLAIGLYKRNLKILYIWFAIQTVVVACHFIAMLFLSGLGLNPLLLDVVVIHYRIVVLSCVKTYVDQLLSSNMSRSPSPQPARLRESGPQLL